VNWFVDCGDDDFLLDVNIDYIRAMKAVKIPVEFRVREGDHSHEYWHTALYYAIPFASRYFK
ncbi:MAG: esterase family protein, partial [Muribaculaceae bacterium]|nr:esterase family protein [Muribaculaceae bacterium]